MTKNKEDFSEEKALYVSEMIQTNMTDLIKTIYANIDEDDIYSMLAAYSSLYTMTSYIEFKLRYDFNVENSLIETARAGAENYMVNMVSKELGLNPQKKSDA